MTGNWHAQSRANLRDLFSSGGRGEEAAEALLTQNLKPAWRHMDLSRDS